MAGFDAGAAVEPLHCKLKPFADFEADIPEPSSVQVQQFLNDQRRELEEIRKRIEEAAASEDPGGGDAKASPKDPTAAQVKKDRRRGAEMYSAVCSGTPPAEILEQLPHRVFAAFANWISEEFLNPEAVTGAGNGQG